MGFRGVRDLGLVRRDMTQRWRQDLLVYRFGARVPRVNALDFCGFGFRVLAFWSLCRDEDLVKSLQCSSLDIAKP